MTFPDKITVPDLRNGNMQNRYRAKRMQNFARLLMHEATAVFNEAEGMEKRRMSSPVVSGPITMLRMAREAMLYVKYSSNLKANPYLKEIDAEIERIKDFQGEAVI